jgi:hypothetical protein
MVCQQSEKDCVKVNGGTLQCSIAEVLTLMLLAAVYFGCLMALVQR